jgi:hypothetical protein
MDSVPVEASGILSASQIADLRLAACRRNPVSRDETVQSPQVEGKADQRPLPLNVLQAS